MIAFPHEVILAKTTKDLEQCIKIRIAVFTHEQKFPIDTEIDQHDTLNSGAAHFLLRSIPSLTPIGTIRGCKFTKTQTTADGLQTTKTYYKLTRFAILSEFRGLHLGGVLVHKLHEWAVEDSLKDRLQTSPEMSNLEDTVKVVAHSQIYANGFYARFGYKPEGEQFDEDGAPHQKMVLHIPITQDNTSAIATSR